MLRFLFFPLFLSIFWNFEQPEKVPDTIVFCGVEVKIEEGAKEKIRDIKKKLYENPTYFNAAVDRGDTYLPFIEEALKDLNVPDDIKYVAMQESNLFPAAVSTSNAVGFWQFKEEAAKESGLLVNSFIDERKHIYLASLAAASYFAKTNRTYDNWLYSIISYYEGVTGVVNYTDPKFYGKKQMTINEKTHWYLLKTIAYKLTYEDALKITYQPTVWLQPTTVTGPITSKEIGEKFNLSEEKILEWNKWISNRQIPADLSYTVYIPHTNEIYRGHAIDPNKAKTLTTLVTKTKQVAIEVQPEPTPTTTTPPIVENPTPVTNPAYTNPTPSEASAENLGEGGAVSVKELPAEMYAEISIKEDLYYGESALVVGIKPEYVLYDGKEKLQDIALSYRLRYADLLLWNNLLLNQEPEKGTILYLKKMSKSQFHIVRPGETLGGIAQQHETSIENIQKKNRMAANEYKIYFGQKLYIKDARPKNEKIVILTHPALNNAMLIRKKSNTAVAQILPAPSTDDPLTTLPPKREEPMVAKSVTETAVVAPKAEPKIIWKEETYTEEIPVIAADQKSQWLEHTVAAGENLWSIAKKYGTRVEVIRKINEMENDAMSPGKTLKIFMTVPNITDEDKEKGLAYHTVLGGEVVEKIAMRYSTTTDTLIKMNLLSPETVLKAGSMLKIPVK